jgi:hypothetical protein
MPLTAIRILAVSTLLASGLAISGCASGQTTKPALADFSGHWAVKWCDKTAPEADCGGFSVDLNQDGDRLSGESFGARARLAQIDEGGVIRGVAVGDTAIITVESLRSGGIYLIEAQVRGECMRWKMRDTVREAERDIDIVAFDEIMTRAKPSPDGKVDPANDTGLVACRPEMFR